MAASDLLAVPESRAAQLRTVLDRLLAARRVALVTHVHADGDGAGSEAAIAAWLEGAGVRAVIANPTPFPDTFRFLLHRPDLPAAPGEETERAVREADLVLVLDTSEAQRVEPLAPLMRPERTVVVDHHPAGPETVGGFGVQDPTAAATGELAYDLLTLAGAGWTHSAVLGIYVALVSDTGSFRYANTSPRVHAIAAELMARGVDPEAVYRRLFATAPPRRLHLLREALGNLHTDDRLPLAWMVVDNSVAERLKATSEDFEGLIEHARSIEGTEVALLFRGTQNGETKISFRSNGETDVNRIARQFGGGGHVKAAGALVPGAPAEVAPKVVEAVREVLRG